MFAQFVDFYLNYEYAFAALQLSLAMLGMGATLRVIDFVAVFKLPRVLIHGLMIQILVVSLLAWGAIELLEMPVGVAVGLALCAAVPGGTTSNIFTHLGKGNSALSVSMTTVSSLACLFTAPIILGLLIQQHMPASFSMPSGAIARDIILNLMVPLGIGMLILKYIPSKAEHFANLCIRLSLLVIVAIVVGASGAGRLDLDSFGTQNVLIVVGFIVVLALVSWWLPRLNRADIRDSVAICMEVTVRNINLAILIHVALFAKQSLDATVANQALLTLLLYGALQMLLCIPIILLGRSAAKRNLAQAF